MIAVTTDTEALARELAAWQKMPVSEAVRLALEAQAQRLGMSRPESARQRQTIAQILAMADDIAAMSLLDTRSPQEILDDLAE